MVKVKNKRCSLIVVGVIRGSSHGSTKVIKARRQEIDQTKRNILASKTGRKLSHALQSLTHRNITVCMRYCIAGCVATRSSKHSNSYPHGQTQTPKNKGNSCFPQFSPVPTLKVCISQKQACCFVTLNHMSPLWQPSLPSLPLSLIAN